MQKHIFISYPSKEEQYALAFAENLIRDGFAVWVDQLGGIKPGDDWANAIEQGIEHAVAMICMMSPAYAQSRWCMAELHRGLGHPNKIPVFPVRLKTVPAPLGTELIHWVDFTDPSKQAQKYRELVATLHEKGIVTDSPTTPTRGIVAPPRTLDENLAISQSELQVLSLKAVSRQGDVKRLQKLITALEEDLDAATNQYTMTIDAVMRVKMNRQMDHIQTELNSWREKLMNLQAEI